MVGRLGPLSRVACSVLSYLSWWMSCPPWCCCWPKINGQQNGYGKVQQKIELTSWLPSWSKCYVLWITGKKLYVSRMLLCFESLCTQQWKRQDVTRVFLSPIWLFIWENKYLPWLRKKNKQCGPLKYTLQNVFQTGCKCLLYKMSRTFSESARCK